MFIDLEITENYGDDILGFEATKIWEVKLSPKFLLTLDQAPSQQFSAPFQNAKSPVKS
jgi:hypothetical protein